jgi:hypothetical protein
MHEQVQSLDPIHAASLASVFLSIHTQITTTLTHNPHIPPQKKTHSGHVDRRSLLDNLDLLMLTIDELVDGGTVLETDATAVTARALMRGATGGAGGVGPNVPLADMTISQAFASAKDSFIKSMGNRDGGF